MYFDGLCLFLVILFPCDLMTHLGEIIGKITQKPLFALFFSATLSSYGCKNDFCLRICCSEGVKPRGKCFIDIPQQQSYSNHQFLKRLVEWLYHQGISIKHLPRGLTPSEQHILRQKPFLRPQLLGVRFKNQAKPCFELFSLYVYTLFALFSGHIEQPMLK